MVETIGPTAAEARQATDEVEVSKEASKAVTGVTTRAVEVSKEATGADTTTVTKKPDVLSWLWLPHEVVYVVVGPEEQRFGIHKDKLCSSSAYFRAAFEGSFQEAVRGEVVLKETSAMAFGMMIEWLYAGKISEELCTDSDLSIADKMVKDKPTFSQLLDVWILADYLIAPQLQNFVIDTMTSRIMKRRLPPVKDFVYFYEHTQSGSPMRKFLVDLCIWRYGEKAPLYRTDVAFMPREMAGDIMMMLAMRAERSTRGPAFAARNYYVKV
ncbi:hypothetical protein V499_08133 [Pseudogymnoascus sp. VKM F-103]|nr:hypothetical protein V499_08133 [Pseudogymnoascus sp. VKM F-103]